MPFATMKIQEPQSNEGGILSLDWGWDGTNMDGWIEGQETCRRAACMYSTYTKGSSIKDVRTEGVKNLLVL